MSLPGAEELFRQTGQASESAEAAARTVEAVAGRAEAAGRTTEPRHASVPRPRHSSGRVKHDEKMTVYVTGDELLDLEHARLRLRREWGVAVDRGRVVREAIAIVLADLEQRGTESELVRRLNGS